MPQFRKKKRFNSKKTSGQTKGRPDRRMDPSGYIHGSKKALYRNYRPVVGILTNVSKIFELRMQD